MDHEKEIKSLLAETIAVQTVLVHVLRRLARSDPDLWKAISAGFDDAVSEVSNVAFQRGADTNSESTLEALRIVEIHRMMAKLERWMMRYKPLPAGRHS